MEQKTVAARVPPSAANPERLAGVRVDDVHSRLNGTRVAGIERPRSLEEVQSVVAGAAVRGQPLCIAGGRHAMGGQQFAAGARMIDTTRLRGIVELDSRRGLVTAAAGTQWPELIDGLLAAQAGRAEAWGIAQKQTGADRLSLGGALAANVHGRGLRMGPIVDDVESFVLVDAEGRARHCSRTENAALFRLAIGGYGLFGVITSVTLRLVPRRKMRREVEIVGSEGLVEALEERARDGFVYGDFQFATDPGSRDFLRRGVLSAYRPVDPDTPIPDGQRQLSEADWSELLWLAHVDRSEAFRRYAAHYRATSGQIYWSDTHQLASYLDDYHRPLDARLGSAHPATEVITEIYVPRPRLADFLEEAAETLRADRAPLIYGTVRLIERDEETFLAWAREPFACVIFNLCTPHTPRGRRRSAGTFRRLIDMAVRRSGSYYLTYHRHATREQVLACHPRLPEFLRLKRLHDPAGRFQSEWFRHYDAMFAGDRWPIPIPAPPGERPARSGGSQSPRPR